MPVPRLFEAASEQAEHWAHSLACLIELGSPTTRAAIITELVGEALVDTDTAMVRERRVLGGVDADLLIRDQDRRWAVAVWSTLGFGTDVEAVADSLYDALTPDGRAIVVVITPDRRVPDAIEKARASGREVHHKSWLRVRDWVQERPERGKAEGLDLFLLTEAEYFLTPRVAELYRLEALMPNVAEHLRPTLGSLYFDMNDLSPAPLIERTDHVVFPRTGDAKVDITLKDGGIDLTLSTSATGPGFAAAGSGSTLRVTDPAQYLAARSFIRATARELLPTRL
jgi:hypothetical protein